MKWSKDIPAESGYYWVKWTTKRPEYHWLEMLRLYRFGKRESYVTSMMDTEIGGPHINKTWAKQTDARFAGPLRPPEEE